MGLRVGLDTGGTFTDLVGDDGRVAKVLSTPQDPGEAVRTVLAGQVPELLAHGTTVATNALLERRGARTALVTSRGFADVIEIARQDRPSLYDQWADRPAPLVPREWRYELEESGDIPALDPEVEAVAVCLLHADLSPSEEARVRDVLVARGHDVTCSHEVSPEFREYERTSTTVVNAYLRPACRSYLWSLEAVASEALVMTSAGGLVPVGEAADVPARLLLSGPAGGVRAAAAVAAANGFADAVTFDMGGTSTDVCLVRGGLPSPAPERVVGGFPVRLPSLDVHTIGAGGGSIARVDAGGALVVGPASAGAVPGPACYGRGGSEPTVTDADVLLDRIPADAAFGGLALDRSAAERAFGRAGIDPAGVAQVVDAGMEQAVRAVSVERGVDPRGLALVAFGGAGPLHACALASALDMAAVVVPPRAGVLSAVGLLCSPRQVDLVQSWAGDGDLEASLAALADEARSQLPGSDVSVSLDCRYEGQSHELTVPTVSDFHSEHERRNGYARPDAPVEVVALRARARRPPPLSVTDLPVVDRSPVVGPAVIAEEDCTIWVADGWAGSPGEAGALVLRRR